MTQTIRFDLETGRLRGIVESQEFTADTAYLVVAGDWAPSSDHLREDGDEPAPYLGDLRPIFQRADLVAFNLECVLADDSRPGVIKAGPILKRPTASVNGLASVPFHLACMANNHVLDLGAPGLRATLEILRQQGITPIGAGLDDEEARRTKRFRIASTDLAVINLAEGEEAKSFMGGPGVRSLNAADLVDQIKHEKRQTDLVIVIVHAGTEHLPIPAPGIRRQYRSFAEAGADLVIGHHPHVVQGAEVHHGIPIFYSLGNFVFDTRGTPRESEGLLLQIGVGEGRITSIGLIPFDIGPKLLQTKGSEGRSAFIEGFRQLSDLIIDRHRYSDVWSAYVDRWFDRHGLPLMLQQSTIAAGPTRAFLAALQALALNSEGASLGARVGRSLAWRVFHAMAGEDPWLNGDSVSFHGARKGRALAVLGNQFDNSSHLELYQTAFQRIRNGHYGNSPDWARRQLVEWRVFDPSRDRRHLEASGNGRSRS